MGFLHSINPLFSASGFVVGLLVGLTGVGGGSLMTPLLVLVFGIHPATAVGTDLLYAGLTKTVGTLVHGANRSIEWRITGRLAMGSVPAAAATILLLAHFGKDSHAMSSLITDVLSFAIVLTAVALVLRDRIMARFAGAFAELSETNVRWLTHLLGAVLGVLVSISSVGAGAIGVTVLVMLYPKLPTVRIVGSDIAHGVPLTLVAGAGHWLIGSIDWPLLASLLIGSIPGIALGSQLAGKVPDRALRFILAGTLTVAAARLWF
jgi:uncharacterized membrane protein YfcA